MFKNILSIFLLWARFGQTPGFAGSILNGAK